jgi:DNA sulfur modification protein DndB
MENNSSAVIEVPAVKIRQGKSSELFSFALDKKTIEEVTTISRVKREGPNLVGYQRVEIFSHIEEIKRHMESENPMIPNALVLAFDERVKFVPSEHSDSVGILRIPLEIDDEDKPGWIVDGQQRCAALRNANVKQFEMAVCAFITNDIQEQREQFILVNSTKPLPKDLIYELLPHTDTQFTSSLQKRRFPAQILEQLNHQETSPLRGLIKTATNLEGVIKDNSILTIIETSLSDGALYRFRDPGTGEGDLEQIICLLTNFWAAVAHLFKDAWGLSPRKSRLMHGAGIKAMGHLMDAISERYFSLDRVEITTVDQFKADLLPLSQYCKWTNGYWDFGEDQKVKWNHLQNVPRDIQILTNYLLRKYRTEVWR